MRQRAAASLLYQSQHAEPAFRNLQKLIFLKIVGRILAFYTKIIIDITTISFNRVVFLRKCIIFAQMKPKKQKLCLYDL